MTRYFRLFLMAAMQILLPVYIMAAAPGKPSNLRCQNKINPAGTNNKPFFGWYVNDPDANEIQSAYQIILSAFPGQPTATSPHIWDSGKIASGKQNYVDYAGPQLKPATRYYWTIKTWDKDGNSSPYADVQYFDTGLFTNADWAGSQWIRRNSVDKDDYTYYRKRASIADKAIKRAIAYVSASHAYEFYLNGELAAKGFVNHYPQYQYYHAYDITKNLQRGKNNQIACLTHWYGGGQGRATGVRGFIFKMIVEYTDGSETIVGTDETWRTHQAEAWQTGQPSRNGEGVGYVDKIDSRKTLPAWNIGNFDDSDWLPPNVIGPPPAAPWVNALQADLTRVTEHEVTPISVKLLSEGKYIIDLGKIYAGVPVITFSGGTAGSMVSLRGGFALNADGTVSTKLNQQTNMAYYFILNGGTAVFKPMVYLGMRYLEVDDSPNVLTTENVRFMMRHFELDPSRSSFTSSNTMLNQVWNLMKYSLIAGAQEGFVDTPTREKGSFLGDGWSEAVPAMSVMGDRVMNDRVLKEFLESQDQYWPDGRLNSVYPNVDGKRDIPDYTQSYLVWVWDYYLQTANTTFLTANYNRLKKVADYVNTYKNENTGLIHNLAGGSGPYLHGIIDWPFAMRYGYDMTTEARTVINAYAYIDNHIIAQIAGTIGNRADSTAYEQKALAIEKSINAHLINRNGVYHDGLYADLSASGHTSQHANVFPLAMGIVPAANRATVIKEVEKQKMSVGMVTVRYLPEAIGEAGDGPHLLELYTNTTWDGWAKNITQGATVTWESWDADQHNESMSHPWGAVGLLGIEQYVLGIKPLAPQHASIQVKPLDFSGKLNSASGTLPTDRGDITISWERAKGTYTLNLSIPPNMRANVYVPKSGTEGKLLTMDGKTITAADEGTYVSVKNVGSGKHIFQRSMR